MISVCTEIEFCFKTVIMFFLRLYYHYMIVNCANHFTKEVPCFFKLFMFSFQCKNMIMNGLTEIHDWVSLGWIHFEIFVSTSGRQWILFVVSLFFISTHVKFTTCAFLFWNDRYKMHLNYFFTLFPSPAIISFYFVHVCKT